MKTLRMTVALSAATLALTWAGVSRAEGPGPDYDTQRPAPDSSDMDNGTVHTGKSTTTQTTTTPTTTPKNDWQKSQTSTTTTTAAVYDETAPAEKTEVLPYNRPLLVAGGITLVGSYAASAIVGAASDQDADKRLFIPVVGPWLDMGQRACGFGDCATESDIHNVLLIGSGVAQAAGLGLMVASLFVPEETRETRSTTMKAAPPPKPEVMVLPASMGPAGAGAFAIGRF